MKVVLEIKIQKHGEDCDWWDETTLEIENLDEFDLTLTVNNYPDSTVVKVDKSELLRTLKVLSIA